MWDAALAHAQLQVDQCQQEALAATKRYWAAQMAAEAKARERGGGPVRVADMAPIGSDGLERLKVEAMSWYSPCQGHVC